MLCVGMQAKGSKLCEQLDEAVKNGVPIKGARGQTISNFSKQVSAGYGTHMPPYFLF
jgi:hypothetical protein